MFAAVAAALVPKAIGAVRVEPTSSSNVKDDGLPVKLKFSCCCSSENSDVKNEEGTLMLSETWGP